MRAAALIVLTVVTYLPAMRAGWIWDDDYYVTHNLNLRSAGGLHDLWFRLGAVPQYYPVTHTTFWIEYHIWGLRPAGFHIDNILLHAASAVMLWILLLKLRIPGAWVAAAIWAVHPINVESVAWVTERKNVLSGFFYFAAMLAYLRAGLGRRISDLNTEENTAPVSHPLPSSRFPLLYFLSLLLFAGALLSKSVTASLPAAILVLIWWKRGRIERRDLWPLIPMFVMGLAMSRLTAYMERVYVGAAGTGFGLSWIQRLLIAGRAVWFYAAKIVWPARLTFIYPSWTVDPSVLWQWMFPTAAVALVIALWCARRKIGRGPLAAILFFGGTLVPALGFVNILPMRYSFVADHFQYLAGVGLIALFVSVTSNQLGRSLGRVLACIVLVALSIAAMVRESAFMNLNALLVDTLEKNPRGSMPNNNYAMLLLNGGKLEEARRHLLTAIASDPHNFEAITNLGAVDEREGNPSAAIKQYEAAIAIEPKYAPAQVNLARLLAARGDTKQAMAHVDAAISANPRYMPAYRVRAALLLANGQLDAATAGLQAASDIDQGDADVQVDLSRLLMLKGDWAAASKAVDAALQIDPQNASAWNNEGAILEHAGDLAGAARAYQRALQLRPDWLPAQRNVNRVRGLDSTSRP